MLKEDDERDPKKPCAAQTANIFSRFLFLYSLKLFKEGRKRELEESDLTQVRDYHRSDKLGEKLSRIWMKEYDKATENKRSPNIFKVLLLTFWGELLKYGLVLFLMEIFIRLLQPLFIGLFIKYFMAENKNNTLPLQSPMYFKRLVHFWSPHQCAIQKNEAFIYGSGIVLTSLITVLTIHPYFLSVLEIGLRIRVACCSLLYRKALRIKLSALAGQTVGNVMNLMSNDVNRFDVAVVYFHYIWIAPTQTLLILFCLYQEVGEAAFYGFFVILGVSIFQIFLALRTGTLRKRSGERTDDRVMQMNEIIQSIGVIKMYAWEYAFMKLINRLRKRELATLLQTSWIRGLIMSFIMFTTRLAIFLTILFYIMADKKMTAERVFVVTSYYQILRMTMTVYFPQGVCMLAETVVSIKRIKVFMLLEETRIGNPGPLDANWKQKMDKYSIFQRVSSNYSLRSEPVVKLVRCMAKYGQEVCLRDINFEAVPGQLTAIVGPVGAGKSVLLKVILGELQLFSGKVTRNGIISFASQEPWLFAGSIRQNILFGQEMDVSRYKAVCSVCELLSDFRNLEFGERTIIGEQGISLSGGQRARVNLARAVYKKADIYLLDDPLSAVDITVGQRLFEKCIKSYLGDKVVILVTHQLQYLRRADQIIILSNGMIVAKGNYTEVLGQKGSFVDLLGKPTTIITDEKETGATGTGKLLRGVSITSAMFASMIDIEGRKKGPTFFPEMRTYGVVGFYNYKQYFMAGAGNCCGIFMLVILFLVAQFCGSGGDFFLSKWVSLEEMRYDRSGNVTTNAGIWDHLSRNQCIYIYGALIIGTIIIAVIRSLTFFAVCMRASFRLHNSMFKSVVKACLQFFRLNPSGRILNRFSKDLGTVDELLPNSFIDTTQLLLNLIGALIVVTLVEVYLLIPVAVMIIAFYFLRKVYLSTSRNVKRLEGIAKSPVFAHLNATLQGLPTIRSMEVEVVLVREFDHLQDIHSSAWFMFLYCSRAFGLWLDLICTAFIGLVTFGFLVLDNEYDGSSVGLAITQCIGLGGLIQWGMRQSAELENHMTSVERVIEFSQIEQEANLESDPDHVPPINWPSEGKIEFIGVSMRYDFSEPYVLKNLNLFISPGEKIGIVGRTGAGKSSILNALFRLSEYEGEVFVDDLDIGVLGLHDLRKKISIIPQEPILFSGTLRYNLDPFGEYPDEAIFNALMDVELQAAITNGIKCLEDQMSERGSNLSMGQRQMVCLARAILRNNTILVMDEATANVDLQTDKFIQHTIRTKFANCTVLTIAHRLITVMDSDRVIVMDAGRCVEFDYPHLLLQNDMSLFYDMVMKTGVHVSNQLKLIAQNHYNEKFGADEGPSTDPKDQEPNED